MTRLLILAGFLAIVLSLGSALVHLVRNKGGDSAEDGTRADDPRRPVDPALRAATGRVAAGLDPAARELSRARSRGPACASRIATSHPRCSPSRSRSLRSCCSRDSLSGNWAAPAEKDALQSQYAAGQRSVVELTAANAATLTQYQRVTRARPLRQRTSDPARQHAVRDGPARLSRGDAVRARAGRMAARRSRLAPTGCDTQRSSRRRCR